jgi:DNA-binding IclR family transcriptional regulator
MVEAVLKGQETEAAPAGERGGVAQGHSERSALQVLDRAFAILSLFTTEYPEWTVSEIARKVELPLSTVHRILGVLYYHAFLARDGTTRRFRLGLAAFELGMRSRGTSDIQRIALPFLRRLSLKSGETALLSVPHEHRHHSLCLQRIEADQALRVSIEPGRRMPLHAGAMQKALLAFMSEEEVESVLARPLERLGKNTITNRRKLRRELSQIRHSGYATSSEETDIGLCGIAVPILDRAGSIVAAVGTVGPTARLVPEDVPKHIALCQNAAADIARTIGCVSWTPDYKRLQEV